VFKDEKWTFQQDGATAHTAKVCQEWCNENCPLFITKNEWPPSSPDLNPLDFCIWSILESNVNKKRFKNVENLKKKLISEWEKIPLEIVRASINSFKGRLEKIIANNGGHIE